MRHHSSPYCSSVAFQRVFIFLSPRHVCFCIPHLTFDFISHDIYSFVSRIRKSSNHKTKKRRKTTKRLLENTYLPICHKFGMRYRIVTVEHCLYRLGWEPYASPRKKYERPEYKPYDAVTNHWNSFGKKANWEPVKTKCC